MKIYVLGIGNIGKLIAHSLARKPNPPSITLLFHRPELASIFKKAGQSIEIISNGCSNTQSSFQSEIITNDSNGCEARVEPIQNIIVATKANHTISALESVKSRLDRQSTVLFTQNGMGIIEKVNELIFPNIESRPTYLASVITHGLYCQSPFSAVHAGLGTMSIGHVLFNQPAEPSSTSKIQAGTSGSQDLLDVVIETPHLAARRVPPDELAQAQMEKLIVNATINPLSAILNRKNGQLFNSPETTRLMQDLLSEASLVVRSLPELKDVPNIASRFSVQSLERHVRRVAELTALNTSSMLQDTIAGRETEIDYINGYIVDRGTQLGIECPHHRHLIQMVKEKIFLSEEELNRFSSQRMSLSK